MNNLRAKLQEMWATLAARPEPRALVISRTAHHHGDAETRKWVAALIESGTPAGAAKKTALALLQPEHSALLPVPAAPARASAFSAASLKRLAKILTVEVSPAKTPADAPSSETAPVKKPIRVDPEMGRLAISVSLASPFRFWVILRHITRKAGGSGKICKTEFKKHLHKYGIKYSARHFNRLLKSGTGLFWNASKTHLYIRSTVFVAIQLSTKAADKGLYHESNRAGVLDVYLSPAGSHEQWEAMLYAGWLTHRECPTISRETLAKLFNRTEQTIRNWENWRLEGIVDIRHNYAQAPMSREILDTYIYPRHGTTYYAKTASGHELRLCWQISNTYIVSGIRQHPRHGQGRKVRRFVNHTLSRPAYSRRGGRLVDKLYFNDEKRLRSYLKKHFGAFYIWRGERTYKHTTHGIYEASASGWCETYPDERVSFRKEKELYDAFERLVGNY